MKRIISAEYYKDYKIIINFNNGVLKMVDMEHELWGTMFEPLKDKNLFKQFRVDADIHTIVWANGADFSPDSLYNMGKTIVKKPGKNPILSKIK